MDEGRPLRVVPLSALVISVSALTIPVIAQIYFRDSAGSLDLLLWLLAVIPAFLLAYHRGWRGVAGALAVGIATLAVTQAALLATNRNIAWPLLLGVIGAYVGISLGIGWLSELFHQQLRRAEKLAMLDELTGLPNRRFARQFLDFEVAAAQRGRRVTLVMMAIDNFKAYRDLNGQVAADKVIVLMGRTLNENTRRMNLVARWGEEEFVAILTSTTEAGGLHFFRRVQEALRRASIEGGPITLSAGIAAYGPDLNSADDLLDVAERLLHKARAVGRNRAVVHDLAPRVPTASQGVEGR
jgi:diguanylate cyclase (GGDEF)-like protein